MRIKLKSKIHTHVEDADLKCEGSITMPKELLGKADIYPYEQVHVLNVSTGGRYITFAIEGDCVRVNGALARKVCVGDEVILLSYEIGRVKPRFVEWKS